MGVFHAKGWWPKSSYPRKFVFLGFRIEESGMSREFCRDVPDPWGCSKSLCKKKFVRIFRSLKSGKEKAHKHKQIFLVTARVGGGSPDRGLPSSGQGQKFMCCVRNLRNINIFVRVPGREDPVPGREDR